MATVYALKENVKKEDLIKLGYEILPEEITGIENCEDYLFKVCEQPLDGHCVNQLIQFYQENAEEICSDKTIRKIQASMGIKFRKHKDGKHYLIDTKDLREMLSMWRLEVDLTANEIYFTISDGSLSRFYDPHRVLDVYCADAIKELEDLDYIVEVEVLE